MKPWILRVEEQPIPGIEMVIVQKIIFQQHYTVTVELANRHMDFISLVEYLADLTNKYDFKPFRLIIK